MYSPSPTPLFVLWTAWRIVELGAVVFFRRPLANRIPWPVKWKLYGYTVVVLLVFGSIRIGIELHSKLHGWG